MQKLTPTDADNQIEECLRHSKSFYVIAGAGSGKTTSLVTALDFIRNEHGKRLRQNSQKILCITYTNRAVEVISSRLGFDSLYLVSTLHSFLWSEIGRFSKEIREALKNEIIPGHIAKAAEKDTGKETKTAIKARTKVKKLTEELSALDDVAHFKYDDAAVSDYSDGQLNHDDVIDVAAHIILNKPILRRILGQKYPYIFVDEAQDTFENIVAALNSVCASDGLPIVGYFGDPMQQIYDERAGSFIGPDGSKEITKEENFRSAKSVIDLLNAFRKDVEQTAAGKNKEEQGSVLLTLIQAETPAGPRKRYTDEQLEVSLNKFDRAVEEWGWSENANVKKLFLVRQMIARRLGFSNLHRLFTGDYASSKAQEDYEKGEHFLLSPFVETIAPLIVAYRSEDHRTMIDVLRRTSPAFDVRGTNSEKTLKEMMQLSDKLAGELSNMWPKASLRSVLEFCREHRLCKISDRLLDHFDRDPRTEDYDDEIHAEEKSDWLCDAFFEMGTHEIMEYRDFVEDNTPFSTQHGVKGEEYGDVLVVFDDVEAAWNRYSFTKTLTPGTSGEATEGQLDRSRKLAYVCFSRAEKNLRIALFTPNPAAAKTELVGNRLFKEDQVSILE